MSVARLIIDTEKKTIIPQFRTAKYIYLAQDDDNSMFVKFEIPKIINGVDITSKVIHIHYANISEDKTSKGLSEASNIEIKGDIVTFDWVVTSDATLYPGIVSVGITIEGYTNVEGVAKKDYSWSTLPFGGVIVHNSLDCDMEAIDNKRDYLINTCNAIVEEAIKREFSDEIREMVNEIKESGEFKPQKGVDYWTEEDKKELVNDVLQTLPRAEGVGF